MRNIPRDQANRGCVVPKDQRAIGHDDAGKRQVACAANSDRGGRIVQCVDRTIQRDGTRRSAVIARQRNFTACGSVTSRCTAYGAVRVNRPKALVDTATRERDVATAVGEIFASLYVKGLEIEQAARCLNRDTAIGCADVARNPKTAARIVEAKVAVAILTLDIEWSDAGDLVILVQGDVALRRRRCINGRPTIGVDPHKIARAGNHTGCLGDLVVRIELHTARA